MINRWGPSSSSAIRLCVDEAVSVIEGAMPWFSIPIVFQLKRQESYQQQPMYNDEQRQEVVQQNDGDFFSQRQEQTTIQPNLKKKSISFLSKQFSTFGHCYGHFRKY